MTYFPFRRCARVGVFAMLALACASPANAKPDVTLVGSYTWPADQHNMGGFSGIEVSADGGSFTMISDRGALVTGTFSRTALGQISAIDSTPPVPLRDTKGRTMSISLGDSEGLALRDDGRMFVSFEGRHRVWAYLTLERAAQLPRGPAFKKMPSNSGHEALAIDGRNRLYVIPERSGAITRPFPVWRYDGSTWRQAYSVERSGGFNPVGADFGPDGRLYLLERSFPGLGFRTRIRRFTLSDTKILSEEILLETNTRVHDNLEGIAVWQTPDGATILTLVSDDNFRPVLQRTEIVEYKVTDPD